MCASHPPANYPSVLATFLLSTYSQQIPWEYPFSPNYFSYKFEIYSYRKMYLHRLCVPGGISSTITSWRPSLTVALSQCLWNDCSVTKGNWYAEERLPLFSWPSVSWVSYDSSPACLASRHDGLYLLIHSSSMTQHWPAVRHHRQNFSLTPGVTAFNHPAPQSQLTLLIAPRT